MKNYMFVFSVLLSCLFTGVVSTPGNAQTITEGMQKQLPAIIDTLNEKNLKNVGVLKFRVRKAANQEISDSVGPMNALLADRLEMGLVLANPFDETKQLKIIEGASDQASRIPGANHLDEEGRRKLFGADYTLAWGDELVKADAFITGGVAISPDNVSARVVLLCIEKNGGEAQQIGEIFTAQLDAQSLSESGESFSVRGIFDGGNTKTTSFKESQKQKQELVRKEVTKVKSQQTVFPLNDPSSPMTLQIKYDNQIVPIEMRDGQAFVREPAQGQEVEIVLIRNASAKGRLGAVLKVNGENTLYRSTVRDLDSPKWIFSPEHHQTVVRGYQIDASRREKFIILSDRESKERAIDYGRHVGQIQLTVFQEFTGPEPEQLILDDNKEDLVAMFRGIHPKTQPKNLGALKSQIRLASNKSSQTRGLIVGGASEENNIKTVKFKPDPTPVMSVTVTYYK